MENKIIDSILKAENQAEDMLEKERKKSENAIEQAQKKAEKIKKDFYDLNQQNFADKSKELENKFATLYQEKIKNYNLQAKDIEENSKKHFQTLIELLKQNI